jgi:site-specific DNA-methyltransferase (adenine-specific)
MSPARRAVSAKQSRTTARFFFVLPSTIGGKQKMMERWTNKDGSIDLRLGRWQDVLADVTTCDAVITDPPYSERTHSGQRHGRRDENYQPGAGWVTTRGIGYDFITPREMRDLACRWPAAAWSCVMCSDDLIQIWKRFFERAGRYAFKSIPLVMPGMNVRLAGDGPSSWSVSMVVARTPAAHRWGTLPGAYSTSPGAGSERAALPVVGAKPLPLMRAIVRDYSRPGDLVVDPYCGGGTTALACAIEGRRCITCECDPKTFELARKRLEKGYTPDMFI